ncbi:hypothetical protein DPMN_118112 [Dreissena polymorpha]|uniref:Uncharacterized protein n=1 Tax=Dreissena polymorpha TaxID=45954 RepID=A0A9D4GG58_DREPO|nr:hypothetical protein DPMN_118112 [Dreissena polymorpha]
MKRSCLAAIQYDGDYEGLVEPVLCREAYEDVCPQPANAGHFCRHGISDSFKKVP